MNKNLEGYESEDIYVHDSFTEDGVKKYNIAFGPYKDIITQREMNLLMQYPMSEFNARDKNIVYGFINRLSKNSNIILNGFDFSDAGYFHDYFNKIEPLTSNLMGLNDVPCEDTISFFNGPTKNENILQDIKDKNKKEGIDSEVIPGTNIEIINYSQCPKCEAIYSLQDLNDYYASPARIEDMEQVMVMRRDTRFQCPQCRRFFKPKLLIIDGTPKAELQFLCKLQTVEGIESFYREKYSRPVLTKNKSNFQWLRDDKKYRLDIDIKLPEIASRPELVSGFLRHTPPVDILAVTSGNTKGLTLFGDLINMNKKISH